MSGKNVIKIKKDAVDNYFWALTQNNEVYRINGSTYSIDDYTASFSAYRNYKFIDIAGYSSNVVAIATNTTNVILYNTGAYKLIGVADGLTDPVISIAVNYHGFTTDGDFIIGTNNGLGRFRRATGVLDYERFQKAIDVHIFESNLKGVIMTSNPFVLEDPSRYPVEIDLSQGGFYRELYKYQQTGSTINTAFYTQFDVLGLGYNFNEYWGNEKGLYQQPDLGESFFHYLDNIPVNKISDIYGFLSFGSLYNGDGQVIKQNLLIGTDKGLYYSTSVHGNAPSQNFAKQFSLFHFDPLGNIKINDISVNTNAITTDDIQHSCESDVFLGTVDGVYILKPDYATYLRGDEQVNGLLFDLPNAWNITQTSICTGSSIKLLLYNYLANNNIQWYKNGVELVGKTGTELEVSEDGDYYAVLYNSCENVHLSTNHLKVVASSKPVYSFNYPDVIESCNSNPVNLKVDDNPAYQYRWYTNGVLNGNITPAFTAYQTGKYKVEVSSCDGTWVPSKEISIILEDLPDVSVTPDQSFYCEGSLAQLSAGIATDPSYVISWFKDGVERVADRNKTTISTNLPGTYTVTIKSVSGTCIKSSAPYQLSFITAPAFTFNYPDELPLCNSASTVLKVTGDPAYQYRWYTNGILNGNTATEMNVTQNGKYKVEVSSCTGNWVPSKEIKVDFINLPDVQIMHDKNVYCEGSDAILSVNIPLDATYDISWFRDGVELITQKNKVSITSNLSGNYTVTVADKTGACSKSAIAYSLAFVLGPVFTFNYPDNLPLCSSTGNVLRVTGSTTYQYRWYKDGVLTGQTGSEIPVTQSGKYKVEVSACVGSFVPSKEIQVDIINVPAPSVTTDKMAYCTGDQATLDAGISPTADYAITWLLNDVAKVEWQNQRKVITDIPGNYIAMVKSTRLASCEIKTSGASITFNLPPVVHIVKSTDATLCEGQGVDLQVSYTAGQVKWATGQTSDKITVNTAGNYRVAVVSPSGCEGDDSIDLQFFRNPVLNLSDVTICTFKQETATITAPAGYVKYEWNGIAGSNVYTVNKTGNVSLRVEDANGCKTTQEINVSVKCPDIHIANTITPNGDGKNDTWNITGLEDDPTATVSIYNRYGKQIFNVKGTITPWDGSYLGKKLPAGTYYYVIAAKNAGQKLSGWVSIIY
ncbi:gliding motility-associated C-terminal domain-containing protein [Mucilaginibacter gossypii]|uniref:T9SS type B sorting domain-containing protein n=1 Tax=Mucilaginibacter gossypii TaxID=551996 RepID=UPI00167B4EA2|nr:MULTISPECIES: gliding motility-associated C-terminal domain-containing protein [Mucilaginibacter]QTE37669.1 gliding motility-associated C-terminal domain-containing protein [Mucilaginibacter gossypii]